MFAVLIPLYSCLFLLFLFPPLEHARVFKQHDWLAYGACLLVFALALRFFSVAHFRKYIILHLLLGLALRVTAQTAVPFTDDLTRYASDGTIWLKGGNPWIQPALEGTAYREISTIYPPLAEAVFALISFMEPGPDGFKLFFGAVELLFLFLFWRRIADLRIRFFLLLNPLQIFECHGEGHFEILSVLFFTLGGWHLFRGAVAKSVVFALLSFWTKLHGIFLFLPVWMKNRGKSTFLLLSANVILAALGAWLIWKNSELTALKTYFSYWKHGQPLYRLLLSCGMNEIFSIRILQLCIVTVAASASLFLLMRVITIRTFLSFVIFSFCFFFPVQHPWYYLLLLPVAILSLPGRTAAMNAMVLIGLNYLEYSEVRVPGISLFIWPVALLLSFRISAPPEPVHQVPPA